MLSTGLGFTDTEPVTFCLSDTGAMCAMSIIRQVGKWQTEEIETAYGCEPRRVKPETVEFGIASLMSAEPRQSSILSNCVASSGYHTL
jgi:hypothetical protein